jgi:integrase
MSLSGFYRMESGGNTVTKLTHRREKACVPRRQPECNLPAKRRKLDSVPLKRSPAPQTAANWQRIPEWHGWHAARSGLGSNLYRLGVPDMVIQRILRHANVSTTATYYIKTAAVTFEVRCEAGKPHRGSGSDSIGH